MNWAASSFSYCWCWRRNPGFYESDLSGKHCLHLASVMSGGSACQMIHDNDITALYFLPLLSSPLLSLLTIPTRTTSQQPPTSDLTPQTSSDTENQFIFPAGLESKVGEKQVLVGSQVRSEARYLQVNLSIFIISLLRRNSLCPSRCNNTKGFLLWCLLMSS